MFLSVFLLTISLCLSFLFICFPYFCFF
jgi:hypothetical protein